MKEFNTEGTIDFFSDDPHLFHPTASDTIRDEFYDKFQHHNIYIIAKTNRLWFYPEMLEVDRVNKKSKCHFVIQEKYNRTVFPLISNVPEIAYDIEVSPYPHKELFLKDKEGNNIRTMNSLQLLLELPDETKPNFEVLYIGKSYGRKRKINITDRLFKQHHKSFKKILIDINENEPDKQLVILAFNFIYEKRIAGTGHNWIDTPYDKEKQRIQYFADVDINRKYKIDLIEEALINYFMPKYNIQLRDSLKKLKSSTIKAFQKLDISGVVVELKSLSTGLKLCSEVVPPKKLHLIQFSTFKDKGKSTFINDEDLNKSREANNDDLLDYL